MRLDCIHVYICVECVCVYMHDAAMLRCAVMVSLAPSV